MGLGETLDKYSKKSRPKCSVAALFQVLSAEDKKILQKALDNDYPTHPLVYALREEGHKMSDNSMNAHRSGKCKCQK